MQIPIKGLFAALTLPLAVFLQEPRTQEPGPQEPEQPQAPDLDIFGRAKKDGTTGSLALMQGAWQLMSVQLEERQYPSTGLKYNGYMLVSDAFMAMTVQLAWDEEENVGLEFTEDYQSFIADVTPQAGGEIECRTLIGASMAATEQALDWEPTGSTRRFKVVVDGSMLMLSWGNGNRLTFGRRRPSVSTKRGFFGVPSAFDRGGSGDLFGRGLEEDAKKDDR